MPDAYYTSPPIPKAFIWKRAHSLTGLWLVLFLMEHLLTNSQAALFFGDDGSGFVNAVNFIKSLPFLPVIEIVLLAIPFLVHGYWGVRYLMTAEYNSFPGDGKSPSLSQYSRNHAYTWQRMTSWILLVGIIAHVVQMRFINYPQEVRNDAGQVYLMRVNKDDGLNALSKRLGFEFYDAQQMNELKAKVPGISEFEVDPLREHQVLTVSKTFGMAELLMVRETFKNPLMIFLYTGLVLAACFHAFNGLWTFMISWGVTLTATSQRMMRKLATGLMVLISFLGLAAIWGSYWLNH